MTVLELLCDHLPSRYIDLIINNISNKEDLNQESSDIITEMLTLFTWEDSREGYQFWEDVTESLSSGSPLPKIPLFITYKPSTVFVTKKKIFIMNMAGTHIDMEFDYSPQEAIKIKNKVNKENYFAFVN